MITYKSPRVDIWKMKLNGRATPFSKRIPLEAAVKASLFWDMPQTIEEIKEKALSSGLILSRIYSGSQTVDWVIELIGINGIKKTYKRETTRKDLADEIEAFVVGKSKNNREEEL